MNKLMTAGLATALVMVSCSTQDDQPAASSTDTPSTTLSASETPGPSVVPTPSQAQASAAATSPSLAMSPIHVGDYLEVTGNGLAVRSGPGLQHPPVSEFLLGRTDPIETTLLRNAVRLPAGYVVRVQLGPLVVDETTWFAVYNVPQAGQAVSDAPLWRTIAPVPYSEIDFELTWIAAMQPDATFVRVTDRPSCSPCYDEGPAPSVVAAGTGAGRVGPWLNQAPAWITFAAAPPSSTATCEFRVTNQAGEPAFLDEPAADYVEALIPGVSIAPDRDASVWLDIAGDCSWAVMVNVPEG